MTGPARQPTNPDPDDGGDDDLTFAAQDLGRGEEREQTGGCGTETFMLHGEAVATPLPPGPAEELISGGPPAARAPGMAALPTVGFGVDGDAADPPRSAPTSFRVTAGAARATSRDDRLPWTVRGETLPPPAPTGPWAARQSEGMTSTTAGTLRQLRQEAVNLTWTAAWRAVTSADPRLRGKRS